MKVPIIPTATSTQFTGLLPKISTRKRKFHSDYHGKRVSQCQNAANTFTLDMLSPKAFVSYELLKSLSNVQQCLRTISISWLSYKSSQSFGHVSGNVMRLHTQHTHTCILFDMWVWNRGVLAWKAPDYLGNGHLELTPEFFWVNYFHSFESVVSCGST